MHRYRFGIEEEYFLVNRQSAALENLGVEPDASGAMRELVPFVLPRPSAS